MECGGSRGGQSSIFFVPRILHGDSFCLPEKKKRLTPGQPMGGSSACRLGGQATLSLGLEGEQSTLECCFWMAIPRSGSPWPWLTDKGLEALGSVTGPRLRGWLFAAALTQQKELKEQTAPHTHSFHPSSILTLPRISLTVHPQCFYM